MKKLLFQLFILFNSFIIFSQTYINGGSVSGTWTKANSPYLINGDIVIDNNKILQIDSGVKIIFQGNFSFTINGQIKANGLIADSIYFTTDNLTIRWKGIQFNSSNPSSSFKYCIIEYSGSKLSGSSANFSIQKGGGISISGTAGIVISNCLIRYNKAFYGGGVHVNNRSCQFINTIIDNNEGWIGGSIYCENTSSFKGCIISNNITHNNACISTPFGDTVEFINCTITKNTSEVKYSELVSVGGEVIIKNTIIFYNNPSIFNYRNTLAKVSIEYSDIEGGINSIKSDYISNGLDYNNNIDIIPVFKDLKNNSFELGASPCINHGKPNFYDKDLTYDIIENPRIFDETNSNIDIGAYEYQDSTFNCPPVIYPIEEHYILKNSKGILHVKYYDSDIIDSHTFRINSSNNKINAFIIDTLENEYTCQILPNKEILGDFYIVMEINDNGNYNNSIYRDSVLIHVGKKFKGIIDYDEFFEDSIQIIDDVIVSEKGSLIIREGSYIQFDGFFKIDVFGRLNAYGTPNKSITFNTIDTAEFDYYGYILKKGWAGLNFFNILNDTLNLNYCNIRNTGSYYENRSLNTNGTIYIYNSQNIKISHCNFDSNSSYNNNKNNGVAIENSSSINISNCNFSNSRSYFCNGAYIYASNSEVLIDSSSFSNTFCDQATQGLISSQSSKIFVRNSLFFNNISSSIIKNVTGELNAEYNKFINNQSTAIYISNQDTVSIINNYFINNNRGIDAGSKATIIGNIFAFNSDPSNHKNFNGGAIDLFFSNSYIANNTFVKNYWGWEGSSIYSYYSSPTIINNIIWRDNGDGIRWYNGVDHEMPDPIIDNNYILDPKFELNDSTDFRLTKESNCINKGIEITNKLLPKRDILGNLRIDSIFNKIDIGAIEFHGFSYNRINVENVKNSILLYPNPVLDYIFISDLQNWDTYKIIDLSGKVLMEECIYSIASIDVNNLRRGMYLICLQKGITKKQLKFYKD